MDSRELITKFLVDRAGTDPSLISDDALLVDLGVDSLMLAEMLFDAEDRLNVSISSDAPPPKTVGEMARLIDSYLAQTSPTA